MPKKKMTIALIGAEGVGKQSFMSRLVDDAFTESNPSNNTLMVKSLKGTDNKATLNFFKLPAGKSKLEARKRTFRMTQLYLLCFSLNNPASFKEAKTYYQEILKHHKGLPNIILIGNKSDLIPTVTDEVISEFTDQYQLPYFPVSVKKESGLEKLKSHIHTQADSLISPRTQRQQHTAERKRVNQLKMNTMNRKERTLKRYQKFWVDTTPSKRQPDPNLQNIRHLLANYCAYIPPSCFSCFPSSFFSKVILFFKGHWKRHHTDDVQKIVSDIDKKSLTSSSSVIQALDTLRLDQLKHSHFNQQGSLSMRLSFIKSKCNTRDNTYKDDDADILKAPVCCAI